MKVDVDKRMHSPGSAVRPLQTRVEHVVIHKIGAANLFAHMRHHGWVAGDSTDSFEVIERFFLEDAEGVSTTTLPGSYVDKKPTVVQWYLRGVPPENAQRAHVPYHFVVDNDGRVAQFIDTDRATAHAGNRSVNASSIAVACIGDFVEQAPTAEQLRRLFYLCRDLLVLHPQAKIVGHSDVSRKQTCPGRGMPIERVRRWAEIAADAVREGPARR